MLDFTKLTPQVQAAAAHAAQQIAAEPARAFERNTAPIDNKRAFTRRRAISDASDITKMNLYYKALRLLGWQYTGQTHPIDRVSVLALGDARLHRDPDFAAGHWVIEINGVEYALSGSPEAITAEVEHLAAPRISDTRRAELEAELEANRAELPHASTETHRRACRRQIELIEAELTPDPQPLTPAREEAAGLKAEYPELAERIDRALALVESDAPSQYKTEWDPAGFYGNYTCNCPDAQHRQPRAKFGIACKHTLAIEITRRVEATRKAAAYRKLADRLERERIAATIPFNGEPVPYASEADDYGLQPVF